MTRAAVIQGAPRDHVRGEDWTDPLSEIIPVRYAQVLARNLVLVTEDLTAEQIAAATGVDRSTVWALRTGRRWPDLVTISRLEWGLGVRLWPLEELLLAGRGDPVVVRDDRRAARAARLRLAPGPGEPEPASGLDGLAGGSPVGL